MLITLLFFEQWYCDVAGGACFSGLPVAPQPRFFPRARRCTSDPYVSLSAEWWPIVTICPIPSSIYSISHDGSMVLVYLPTKLGHLWGKCW